MFFISLLIFFNAGKSDVKYIWTVPCSSWGILPYSKAIQEELDASFGQTSYFLVSLV